MFMAVVMFFSSITFWGMQTEVEEVHAAEVITIDSVEKLQKIGNDSAYPMDGDYVLTKNLDLTGINFTPIGGGYGDKGAVSGNHVFNGTFDGQGYTITGLSIQKTTTSTSSAQIGLFGTIGSNSASDYAVVKNIVFKDVDVNVTTNVATSVGALAGDVAGYAVIDNIAVESGNISAVSGTADIIGIAGIIGEIRTNQNIFSDGNIHVQLSNLYNAAAIHASGTLFGDWCAGIVGRIQYSAVDKMEACLNVGTTSITNSDYSSQGLCGGNALDTITDCYYLNGTGGNASGSLVTEEDLKSETLLKGFSKKYWKTEAGTSIIPLIIAGTQNFQFGNLTPVFAEGENANSVTQNFTLPLSVEADGVTQTVTWTSSNSQIIEIQGANAIVHPTLSDMVCVLTASIGTDIQKEYEITVVSSTEIKAEFDVDVAKVGTPLKVVVDNLPEGYTLEYKWKVGNTLLSERTDSYTPTESDLENFITCTVSIPNTEYAWSAVMYMSTLPVVYISTENGQEITDKENYIHADCKIQGNEEFESTKLLYDGVTEIRGRGNFTWARPKKPYKLKLDKKTSIFGMDESKHWVLLANYADTSLMKNELFGELWEDMEWEYTANAKPVILIMNGEYEGVYHISENIRIEEGRVDIHDWEEDAEDIAKEVYSANKKTLTKADRDAMEDQLVKNLSWVTTRKFNYNGVEYNIDDAEYDLTIPTDITGGYLLELDTYDAYHTKVPSDFLTDLNQQMTFKTPEFVEGTNDEMFNYAKNYIQAYENAAISDDHATQYDGKTMTYSELFDMETIVKYWLSTEIITNGDGMRFSNFMYKDIGWDKFKMGPMWDYDWTWNTGTGAYEWQTNTYVHNNNDQWYKHLIKDPYFVVQVYEMYQLYKDDIADMVKDGGDIDIIYEKMKTVGVLDMEKWHTGEDYKGTVDYVKYFGTERVNWLNTQFKSLNILMNSLGCAVNTRAISLGTPDTDAEKGKTTIGVTTSDSNIKTLVVQVNGKIADTFDVTGSKTTIVIEDNMLTAKEDGLNTVQIFAKDANEQYIKENGEAIWSYTTFKKADLYIEPSEPENPKPENPEPENPTPENPEPENPKPENPTPENPQQDNQISKEAKAVFNAKSIKMQVKKSTTGLQIAEKIPADDTIVKWSSSKPTVVKVNQKGKITAKKVGKAVITVTMASGASASCTVKVQKKPVATTKLILPEKKITMKKGTKYKVLYTRLPFTASDHVKITSSNKKVIKVLKNSMIRAMKKKGTAYITVTAGKKKQKMKVVVR